MKSIPNENEAKVIHKCVGVATPSFVKQTRSFIKPIHECTQFICTVHAIFIIFYYFPFFAIHMVCNFPIAEYSILKIILAKTRF